MLQNHAIQPVYLKKIEYILVFLKMNLKELNQKYILNGMSPDQRENSLYVFVCICIHIYISTFGA